MGSMIVVLWVVVFAGLVLAPFPRTLVLFAATMGVWLASVILTVITDPQPWGMGEATALLLSLFVVPLLVVPLLGRLVGAVAHRALRGTFTDTWDTTADEEPVWLLPGPRVPEA